MSAEETPKLLQAPKPKPEVVTEEPTTPEEPPPTPEPTTPEESDPPPASESLDLPISSAEPTRFPRGSVLFYDGPSGALQVGNRVIGSGKPFFYDPAMDAWLDLLMPHGHQFHLMSPEQRANTPDSVIE